ncbi:MAG: aspartate carbamoyltransferase [Candidatus Micrarchaeota archaeon]|nr:aspartate carbamoyltransferase [Candidatus Micrarchaeota archaeon]
MAEGIGGKVKGGSNPLYSRSLLSIKELDRPKIDLILREAEAMHKIFETGRKLSLLKDKAMATLFYEPSTRTKLTFQRAMIALGGDEIGDPSMDTSSAAKGENLADTARVVSSFSDVIVLRHYDNGAAEIASRFSAVPVINAGNGSGEHPTQALLDLLTIKNEKRRIEGMKVAIVGDLRYGRAVHSLAYTLGMFDNDLVFIAPEELQLPKEICDYLELNGRNVERTGSLDNALDADVVYIPRIQKERFMDPKEYNRFLGMYRIDRNFMKRANPEIIVMSHGPRLDEISPEIDDLNNMVFFKQVKYGVAVRMAVLNMILGKRMLSK